MNWNRIEGNWKQIKGKVKKHWGKLTESDMDVVAGKRDLLVRRVKKAYGIGNSDAEKQVSDWEMRHASYFF